MAPAIINGVTWPIPKKNKKIIEIIGFLACDTQARRVAKTGVMQGEEASPKVVPIAKGAIKVGILSSIIFLFFFGIGQVTPLIIAGATAENLKKFLELRKFSQIIPTLSGIFLVSLGLLNLLSNWI